MCCWQVVDVGRDTVAIRSIDWDRDRFDIEFGSVLATTLLCKLLWPISLPGCAAAWNLLAAQCMMRPFADG